MKYWVVQHCTIASSHNSSPHHKWNHKSKQWNSCKKIKLPTLGYLISNFAYIYHFQIKYLLYINFNFDKNRNSIWNAIVAGTFNLYSGAQKKDPCAIKVNLCANKMSQGIKNFSLKNYIFFVDKLNMIDFNIFKMLKLIFTCESCAISITE